MKALRRDACEASRNSAKLSRRSRSNKFACKGSVAFKYKISLLKQIPFFVIRDLPWVAKGQASRRITKKLLASGAIALVRS